MLNFSYENFLSKKTKPEQKKFIINRYNENYNEEYLVEINYVVELLLNIFHYIFYEILNIDYYEILLFQIIFSYLYL